MTLTIIKPFGALRWLVNSGAGRMLPTWDVALFGFTLLFKLCFVRIVVISLRLPLSIPDRVEGRIWLLLIIAELSYVLHFIRQLTSISIAVLAIQRLNRILYEPMMLEGHLFPGVSCPLFDSAKWSRTWSGPQMAKAQLLATLKNPGTSSRSRRSFVVIQYSLIWFNFICLSLDSVYRSSRYRPAVLAFTSDHCRLQGLAIRQRQVSLSGGRRSWILCRTPFPKPHLLPCHYLSTLAHP